MHTKSCLEKNPRYKKLSRPAQKRVSKKIAILIREGYSNAQAAAIAFKLEREHKLGERGGYKRNPPFPIQWKTDKNRIHRADLMDFRKTVIVVWRTADGSWTWEMKRKFPNGNIIDEGDFYDSDEEAKSEAIKFYDETSETKSNPIADKDVQMCAMSLLYISRFPEMVENIPNKILDALIEEGLWDNEKMEITGKGEKFLLSLEK